MSVLLFVAPHSERKKNKLTAMGRKMKQPIQLMLRQYMGRNATVYQTLVWFTLFTTQELKTHKLHAGPDSSMLHFELHTVT